MHSTLLYPSLASQLPPLFSVSGPPPLPTPTPLPPRSIPSLSGPPRSALASARYSLPLLAFLNVGQHRGNGSELSLTAGGGCKRDHFNLRPHAKCMFQRPCGRQRRQDGRGSRERSASQIRAGFSGCAPDAIRTPPGGGGGLAGVHINIFRIEHLSEIQEADYFTLSAPTEGCTFYRELWCCRQETRSKRFQTMLTTPPVFLQTPVCLGAALK